MAGVQRRSEESPFVGRPRYGQRASYTARSWGQDDRLRFSRGRTRGEEAFCALYVERGCEFPGV
jgi:hypothetical protein